MSDSSFVYLLHLTQRLAQTTQSINRFLIVGRRMNGRLHVRGAKELSP